jgi:anti-sigma factor RsiW
VTCNPELVTGYVDDALEPAVRAELELHLSECALCREQADAETRLRAALRALPSAEPRRGFEAQLRRSLARARPSRLRLLLPIAAVLALAAFWGLRMPAVLAWELARDHKNCFGKESLPAEVWGGDAAVIVHWFEAHGTSLPPVPDGAGGLSLVGGRRCPLADRSVAHLYYSAGDRRVSLFVIPGSVAIGDRYETTARHQSVRIFHIAGQLVGVVGENADDVRAFERSFRSTAASLVVEAREPEV